MKNWIDRNSTTRTRRLNARQRKKFHLAEFKELGFKLTLRFKQALTEAEREQWINALCQESERLALLVGGFGAGPDTLETEGFVAAEKGSTSEAQRSALLEHVRAHPLVAEASAGDLVDGWYSA